MSDTNGIATSDPCGETEAQLIKLIGQVAEGDHKAFRKLYDLTNHRLFCVAFLLLKRRDKAEDAVQEALVRIWTRAGTFDPCKGMPLPWLARIVRNIALDQLRREGICADCLDDHLETASESPISLLAVAELNKCLASLDPAHRAAWWMIHLDGLSRQEAAWRMNVPLGTVKSWVFRSSRRIRHAVSG